MIFKKQAEIKTPVLNCSNVSIEPKRKKLINEDTRKVVWE
jgi:hypothetical protein